MIEERGPAGTRAFGQGQADNYRLILQGAGARSGGCLDRMCAAATAGTGVKTS